MSDKIIQYNLDQVLGVKKYTNITDTNANYLFGGMLASVIINKSITGTITLVDQASAASATAILSTRTSATRPTIVNASGLVAQPDYPRCLVITPGGTTANVAACSITVDGLDVNGAVISEDFAFADAQSSATNGSERFASISNINIPTQDGADVTFSVGTRAGDTICVITNPSAGDIFPYNIELKEGLELTASATPDIIVTYIP